MENPSADEVASHPRPQIAGGCNVLFLFIVLLLIAVTAFAAWLTWPADTPKPSSTGNPTAMPGGNGN